MRFLPRQLHRLNAMIEYLRQRSMVVFPHHRLLFLHLLCGLCRAQAPFRINFQASLSPAIFLQPLTLFSPRIVSTCNFVPRFLPQDPSGLSFGFLNICLVWRGVVVSPTPKPQPRGTYYSLTFPPRVTLTALEIILSFKPQAQPYLRWGHIRYKPL